SPAFPKAVRRWRSFLAVRFLHYRPDLAAVSPHPATGAREPPSRPIRNCVPRSLGPPAARQRPRLSPAPARRHATTRSRLRIDRHAAHLSRRHEGALYRPHLRLIRSFRMNTLPRLLWTDIDLAAPALELLRPHATIVTSSAQDPGRID